VALEEDFAEVLIEVDFLGVLFRDEEGILETSVPKRLEVLAVLMLVRRK